MFVTKIAILCLKSLKQKYSTKQIIPKTPDDYDNKYAAEVNLNYHDKVKTKQDDFSFVQIVKEFESFLTHFRNNIERKN